MLLKKRSFKSTIAPLYQFLQFYFSQPMSATTIAQIHNFLQLSAHLATAGQPTAEEFELIKNAGYQVVVNLALPTSTKALPNEQAIVEALGMQYIHIPVIWEQPTQQEFDRFAATLQANADKPVFVHCAMNMRVSVFVYLYRRHYEGISETQAQQDLQQIWTPNSTWQQFIAQVQAALVERNSSSD
jgi:uncharacterized protein (TIGR01244 family)